MDIHIISVIIIVFIYSALARTPLARKRRFGRGGDAVGNPRRTQSSQFEFFELILLLKLDKRFAVEQFEATISQSTVPNSYRCWTRATDTTCAR